MSSGPHGEAVLPVGEIAFERPSTALRVLRFMRTKPLGAFGAALVIFLTLGAVFADVLAPYDPTQFHSVDRLAGPSGKYWMGTDQFGRDLLSRTLFGTRISFMIAFLSVIFGSFSGALIGVASGYLSGKVDIITQRFTDMLMSFPTLILAIGLVAVLGASTVNLVIVIAITFAPRVTRIVRSAALSIREEAYTEAARAMGCSNLRIIFRHVAPNCVAPFLIISTAELGGAILTESSLSFLGLGATEPNASLGYMLTSGSQGYFEAAPGMAIFPGLAISLAVFGVNVFGDALRDVLDPRLRGR